MIFDAVPELCQKGDLFLEKKYERHFLSSGFMLTLDKIQNTSPIICTNVAERFTSYSMFSYCVVLYIECSGPVVEGPIKINMYAVGYSFILFSGKNHLFGIAPGAVSKIT